ncbi:hypothetical protein NP233_g9976 [Leucocoprinus birnbaumii]|uniref:Uncharacterized protein n=1 Tax=Leucocoprinus birnbaumii TaxID=56174 RepID=A0AAD5VQ20_9AGAR|nr:hypothetical protein NP233_g9976 [Leucocoprinus birnbaumii]
MAVQDTPAEIWSKIFELSCTDGGQTGRSLALVSHYIHAVSKPYQYQSIALVGPHAIEHFGKTIANDPQRRRVKYLFVSTFKPDPAVLDCILGGPLHTHKLLPRRSPLHQCTNSEYNNNQLQTKSNYAISADMYRILDLIAPTILNLHVLMDFYRGEIFFSTPFAVLEELSIQGPFHDHEDCNDEFCDTLYPPIPSLKRLYLTDVFTCVKDRTYLAIRHYAPYLTHLKIQCAEGYIESGRTFLRQLMPLGVGSSGEAENVDLYGHSSFGKPVAARGSIREDEDEDNQAKRPRFPDTLQRILFHPGPAQSRGRCAASYMVQIMRQTALRELEKCALEDPRIKLFDESPWMWPYSREYGYVEGKKQWLDGISGGVGGWEDS